MQSLSYIMKYIKFFHVVTKNVSDTLSSIVHTANMKIRPYIKKVVAFKRLKRIKLSSLKNLSWSLTGGGLYTYITILTQR